MIFIILFISSFEVNEVNHFPALTALFPLVFLSNLFIAFEVKLLTNPGKLSLVKGIAMLVSACYDPPDWIIVDSLALLDFTSVDMLLAKAFLILFVCLVVRNNYVAVLHHQSFSFLILILFLSYFLLLVFICVIVFFSLTLAYW